MGYSLPLDPVFSRLKAGGGGTTSQKVIGWASGDGHITLMFWPDLEGVVATGTGVGGQRDGLSMSLSGDSEHRGRATHDTTHASGPLWFRAGRKDSYTVTVTPWQETLAHWQ